MRSPSALSCEPILYQPAMWNTPSTPAIGPCSESGSLMSPGWTSTPRDEVPSAFWVPRDRDHLVAGIDQLPGDPTADEAGSSRHEVLRHRRAPNEATRSR